MKSYCFLTNYKKYLLQIPATHLAIFKHQQKQAPWSDVNYYICQIGLYLSCQIQEKFKSGRIPRKQMIQLLLVKYYKTDQLLFALECLYVGQPLTEGPVCKAHWQHKHPTLRNKGMDYSAFSRLDTQIEHKLLCTRN